MSVPGTVEEARSAGRLLKDAGYVFDVAFTSYLKRAITTCWWLLEELDQTWIPVYNRWRLNERHYGALQGLDKAETAAKYGEEQVLIWRRSYDVPPPPMKKSDPGHPKHDRRYENVPAKLLPSTESLKTTLERVLPYWRAKIAPQLEDGQVVLVAAHGNSLRALVKHLDGMSDEAVVGMEMVQAFGREPDVRSRFGVKATSVRDASLSQAGVEARFLPGLIFVPTLAIAAVLLLGGRQVARGDLTAGEFALFITLLLQLVWPLEALGWIVNLGQRALASAGRSFAWLEGIEPLRVEVARADRWGEYPLAGGTYAGVRFVLEIYL